MDGLIISNHGGRQCDYVPAAVDMLPQIVEVVNRKVLASSSGHNMILLLASCTQLTHFEWSQEDKHLPSTSCGVHHIHLEQGGDIMDHIVISIILVLHTARLGPLLHMILPEVNSMI